MAPVAMSNLPTTTGEYHILLLQISAPAAYPTPSTHYLYIRTHQPKLPDAKSPRSLFIVNVPIDATEHHFRSLFAEQLGGSRVESVEFETTRPTKSAKQTPAQSGRKRKRRSDEDDTAARLPEVWDREVHRSGSAAIVVFVDEPSMQIALKNVKKTAKARNELVWGQGLEGRLPALGLQRYQQHHELRYPPKGELQAAVDAYMSSFAAAEATKSRTLARQRAIPDEDGFVTVTRGGRAGPARNEEAQAKMEELRQKEEDKRSGMGDFYRFQVREKKKQAAGELVKRFQDERRRMDEMRQQKGNKFKPT